ncbi:MAG: AraC family transcriptional regulator [Pedobacter sp.]|nr:MAG: AraC family transcriptional regulator [Pedobacter sp.]
MEKIEIVNTVRKYNTHIGADTLHPLVSVVDFNDIPSVQRFAMNIGLYAIFLKDVKCGNMRYGCQPYDYEDGTLVFLAPGQTYGIDSHGVVIKPSGYALVFHPDFILNTHLGKIIKDYTFFSYEVNEALHLSKKERKTIVECLVKIAGEIEQNMDKHSKTLIISTIELLLNYCMRFYDRQFITRNHISKDILIRFENLLDNYFKTDKAQTMGLPSVAYCADQLNLSANYFGDLIKKEAGTTALEYIQLKLIDEAKSRIFNSAKSINQIAGDLGFRYQQHFTRLFKQKTGLTPNEYRKLN